MIHQSEGFSVQFLTLTLTLKTTEEEVIRVLSEMDGIFTLKEQIMALNVLLSGKDASNLSPAGFGKSLV